MKKFISLFVAIFIVFLLALPAYAADIAVDADCSLADAIKAANTDEAVGGCSAGDSADTVTLSGNVRLSRALPLVTSNMTIEGGGFTISGNGRTHIICINNRGILTINEVTISNGQAGWGGAIGNFGKLTITNSTITRNSAEQGGAIGNDGTLTIRNSTIDNNMAEDDGGAIYIDNGTLTIINTRVNNNNLASAYGDGGAIYNDNGTLTITDSTFSNNSADDGGVIYSDSTKKTNIASSAFIRNSAGDRGGAIFIIYGEHTLTDSTFNGNSADGNGGAIYNWEDLIITNSTFSNNSTDGNGGAIYNRRDLTITNSTFSSNLATEDGGGLYQASDSTVNLRNSIIASSKQGGDCYGRLNTNTSNLTGDGSCYVELSDDPMLGELVEPEDGSPAYFPLLAGSPAIDAADDGYCPETDQIGTVRPQGGGCDIGAIEYAAND